MQYYGYAGNILYVDLTSGDITKQPLDFELARGFIGGMGINNRLLYDLLKPNTEAFSPGNPIIIGVGPLCGTLTPGASKVAVTTKLPTIASKVEKKQIVGTGMSGTRRFGVMIKNAGYDHVVITGQAKKPCYLKIVDDDIEICDASDLWGRDIYETTDELAERHRGHIGRAGVWAIGRGGENLIRWSVGICDKMAPMGNLGAAAVLGSKNLKAVVSLGTKGVKVAHRKRFMELVDRKRRDILMHPSWGTTFPHKKSLNYAWPQFKVQKDFPMDVVSNKTMYLHTACTACVDGCRFSHEIRDGRFAGTLLQTGHLASALQGGTYLCLQDYREAIQLQDIFNREGLSHPIARRMLNFVTRLYERGIISTKDTGGLMLKRGNFDCYAQLVHKIIKREDIGAAMAEGWYPLSDKVGVDASEDFYDGVPIIKGVNPIIDPRLACFNPAFGLAMFVGPRAQHVHQSTYFPPGDDMHRETYWPRYERSLNDIKEGCKKMGCTLDEIDSVFTQDDFNTGRLEKHAEDQRGVMNSLGVCDSAHGDWDPMQDVPLLSKLYSAVTGIEINYRELKKMGERIWNMEKLINVREDFTRKDDEIPTLIVQNAETTKMKNWRNSWFPGEHYLLDYFGRRLRKSDLQKMLDDYYEERGWDVEKGIPTREKLLELGLEDFIGVVDVLLR